MIKTMARRLSGTAYVRVSGDTARFLNILVRSGIFPLEMHTENDCLYILIHARQFKKLHAIKHRTHTEVRLEKKSGLPFVLRHVRKRPGIAVGVLLAVVLYVWLSGFIWCVEAEGEAPYAHTDVLFAAKASGVYVGARKSTVDLPTAANGFIRILPNISWASFNSDGCRVTLDYRPAVLKEKALDKSGAYDIAARLDGLVKKITAQSGTVLIETGSAVKAGQTLVSGVAVIGDPWDPNDEVRHLLSHARAEIIAETRHTFTASCPLAEETVEEVSLGERKMLCIFGWKLPLSLHGASSADKYILKKSQLSILGTDLPVWIETQRCFTEKPKQIVYSEEQAKRRALERLRVLQENYLGKTGCILNEELRFSEKNGVVHVVSHCTVEEDIAMEIPMGGAA